MLLESDTRQQLRLTLTSYSSTKYSALALYTEGLRTFLPAGRFVRIFFSITLAKLKSAFIRFSRIFSSLRALSSLRCFASIPPHFFFNLLKVAGVMPCSRHILSLFVLLEYRHDPGFCKSALLHSLTGLSYSTIICPVFWGSLQKRFDHREQKRLKIP